MLQSQSGIGFEDTTVHVFVNGFGATPTVVNDSAYARYLGLIKTFLTDLPKITFIVHLCGGNTNKDSLTEAETMKQWFDHHGLPSSATLRLIDTTYTVRENLERFRENVGDVNTVIFCEHSRWPAAFFLAGRIFTKQQYVIAIPLDDNSRTLSNCFKLLFLRLPPEILAWYLPFFDRLRLKLRNRNAAKARAGETTRQ